MGLSNTQYRDIMYKYDQLRLKNKRIVAARYEKLFNKIPKLKEIQNEIINLSTNQARMELLSPDEKLDEQTYREKKSQLIRLIIFRLSIHVKTVWTQDILIINHATVLNNMR